MSDEVARLRHWQTVTVATLFTGYAGYYLCRANLSVATPLLLADYGPAGLNKAHIGDVASVGLLLYAAGKLLNGVATEYAGGRRMFLFGLFASVACTVLFALAPLFAGPLGVPLLAPFFVAWAANRFVQSMGWGSLVQIAGRWFPTGRTATVMGVLSLSYLLGDAAVRLYLGAGVTAGLGWRGVFLVSAATLAAIGLVTLFALRGRPADVGLPEPPPDPENVYGADAGHGRVPLRSLLGPLFASTTFWLVCLMNAGLTFIRMAFGLWNPTYLTEVAKFDPGAAAMASLVFPLAGAVAAVLGGWLVDRTGGRFALVAVPSLVGLVAVLGVLAWVPLEGRACPALVLIGAAAFFLTAPYTFCAGALAVKLGGQRGGAAAAGLIDTAGYLGSVAAGSVIGRVATSHGWGAVFESLAGVGAVALLVTTACALRVRPTPAAVAPNS